MTFFLRIIGAFCLLVLLSGSAINSFGYHVNITNSLPRGIYKIAHGPVVRGALVVECLLPQLSKLGKDREWIGRGSCPSGTMPILKRVVGVPGDTVTATRDYIQINSFILLNTASLFLDSQGREIPRVGDHTYTLQPGQVLLLADNPQSWDSRYMGSVDMTTILATAEPVWLWED